MPDNQKPENRHTNMGSGNYNERIERDYVQGNAHYIYNYYGYSEETKVTPHQPASAVVEDNLSCPYRGLLHFRPEDTEFFFGREIFIEELLAATQIHNFIPVFGASGSGKSSVVLAGLVPKLQQAGHWKFTHFRPGSDPFHALALALVPLYTQNLDATDKIIQARKLSQSLGDGEIPLTDVFAQIHQNHPTDRVLLIADQFEEIYTLCADHKIRHSFLDSLLASFQSSADQSQHNHVLVATMRADFLGNALLYPPFGDVLKTDIKLIRSMNHDELSQVIAKPAAAEKLGVTFEVGLVERILDDVEDEPGNLPLLEFALTELWEQRQGKQLTHAAYQHIGKVQGALARHADQNYGKLSAAQKEQVRRIFIQLVQPGEGTQDTRRLATKAELGEKNWQLVKQLADARLVVTSQNAANQETVEVVHEALIRNWDEFRQWMDEDRTFRSWQEGLRFVMHEWENNGKNKGSLLQGIPLTNAEDWLRKRKADLAEKERKYITESLAERDRLQQEEKQRQQRELDLLKMRTKLAMTASGFAVSALAILSFSFWQQGQSQKTIEAVFLGTDTTEILDALPKLYTEANNFRNQVDKLKSTDDPVNYYHQHEPDIKHSFAYYRNILAEINRLQNKTLEPQVKDKLKKMSEESEKALSDMLNKYRIPQLKSELSKPNPNFGKRKPGIETTQFEKQYTEASALRMTYEILMGDSGAGADLNKDGFIQDKQEANQIPCDILRKIEKLWREATGGQCGWSGEEGFYQANNCTKLDRGESTLYSSIFPTAVGDDAINRLKSCGISPKSIN
jgi:hypothetical protein